MHELSIPVPLAPSPPARLIAAAVGCCVLEGSVRKWFLPEGNLLTDGICYFSKDLLLLAVILASPPTATQSRPLLRLQQIFKIMAVAILVASLPNLARTPPLGAILSMRSLIVLPAMALAVSTSLRSQRDIEYILHTIGVLAVVNAVLGIIQFYGAPEDFLNRMPGGGVAITAEDHSRAMGTFAYISGMGHMTLLATWAGCCLLARYPMGASVYIAAGLLCGMASMSRGGFFFSLGLLAWVFLTSISRFRTGILVALLLVGTGRLLMSPQDQQDNPWVERDTAIIRTILTRHQNSDSIGERGLGLLQDIPRALMDHPIGQGLGYAQVAAQADTGEARVLRMSESEQSRIIGEIGLLGWLAVLLFRVSIVATLWGARIHSRDNSSYFRQASLAGLAISFLVQNTAFDHVASFFACVMLAVTLAGLRLDEEP